ncbi:MAG: amino acid ABC transporter permease, partial [Chloroflexota bacterium]
FMAGMGRVSQVRAIRAACFAYVEVIRGVPLLVIIYLIYFGIGTYANVPRFLAAVVSLGIFSGAYVAEIVRAAVESVSKGQIEAALSLGFTYRRAMRKIVLPQAFKRMVPPLAGQFIALTKDSSLASIVAISELTLVTTQIISITFRSFQFWIVTAIIYFMLGWILSRIAQYLEWRFHVID